MADPKHLELLRKGTVAWNQWRAANPEIRPDLRHAGLRRADLNRANLRDADMHHANLREADLRLAILHEADLSRALLTVANLSKAELSVANFTRADLRRADLRAASLWGSDFNEADLRLTDFTGANIGSTVFTQTNLSHARGLDQVKHYGPSSIGIDTFLESQGKIPEAFLRGCGVPDIFIQYAASLAGKPFDYYSCFISYSSKDEDFARRLHADLQAKGVRCWFAPEDLKIGDKFRVTIDETIRLYDKLLLVLSEHSVQSDWVDREVEATFEKEGQQKRTMLFPIRLDDAVMNIPTGWPADIRRTRHIGDFHAWRAHDTYQTAFARLLRDLKSGAPNPKDKATKPD